MISYQFQGRDQFLKKMAKVTDPARRTDLFDHFGYYLLSSTQQRFIDQVGPDGRKWKPSARAKQQGGSTLRNSGMLFSSLTYQAAADSVVVGSNKIYAGIHQLGGTIRPKSAKKLAFRVGSGFVFVDKVTMPARPYLGVNDADREELENIGTDWLEDTLQ